MACAPSSGRRVERRGGSNPVRARLGHCPNARCTRRAAASCRCVRLPDGPIMASAGDAVTLNEPPAAPTVVREAEPAQGSGEQPEG